MIDWLALVAAAALIAIWAVYPLAVAAVARFRASRPVVETVPAPTVSVVIATRELGDALTARVGNCFGAAYDAPMLDVVVGVDGVADVTVVEARLRAEWGPRVQVLLGDAPGGKAATLNAAVRVARGDALVFTDAHQRFEPGTIRALVARLADPAVGVVSGSLRLREDESGRGRIVDYYWRYERWLRRCEARVHSSVGVTGAVYAVRRALWSPLPAGLILDDVFVPMQVVLRGSRVAWAEDARAVDLRRPSPRQEYRRKVRTLTGVIQLCAWVPALLHPFRNPVWLQFVFHKVLRLATPYLVLSIGVWFGARVGAVVGRAGLAAVAATLGGGLLLEAWRQRRLGAERGFFAEALLLQAAVVVATFNGLRRRWKVWQ